MKKRPLAEGRAVEPGDGGTTDALGRSLELLAKVRSGALAGQMLAPSDRQALVSLLAADGLSTPEIAQILQVADRTIERDRRAIRTALSVPKDPRLVEQMVGRLMAEAELAVQRIRRTAREREVDAAIKIDAEHRCFEIVRDLVQSLQKLGYLPRATQKVEADLTHHVGELPSLTDLQTEIERLKLVEGGDVNGSALVEIEHVVERATLASRVKDIVSTQDASASSEEEDHHVTPA
jgi:DNA-binding CsgD family transcriptional regulator